MEQIVGQLHAPFGKYGVFKTFSYYLRPRGREWISYQARIFKKAEKLQILA